MLKKQRSKRTPLVTGSIFYKYFSCPHWPYWDVFGRARGKSRRGRFAELLLEQGLLDEQEALKNLKPVEVRGRTAAERRRQTLKLMRTGTELIGHGTLRDGDLSGEPDLLEKRTDRSSELGPWHYVPIEIKSAEKLSDAHRAQLSLYGELLSRVQGLRPEMGYVLNRSGVRLGFPLADFAADFERLLAEIRPILAGQQPPPHLSSGCKQSPWFAECRRLAERTNDVAQLYNVRKKALTALRERGVRTVADALKMKPDDYADDDAGLSPDLLARLVIQAKALTEKKHFLRAPIELPSSKTEIFFDIEGDPLRQVEYLFGFLVRDAGGERYEYQLAERPEDERRMWQEFLGWCERLPDDYIVYHYGTYEKSRLATLERQYDGNKALKKFRSRLVDLNEIIKDAVVFPLYFYGLKDIGEYVGFERAGRIENGGDSVAYYEDWLRLGRRSKLDAVIEYNRDDVEETRFLKDWLAKQSPEA